VDGAGPPDLIASAYEDPEAVGYNKGRVYVFANGNAGVDRRSPERVPGSGPRIRTLVFDRP
jgi:hypothetical protein